MQPLLRAGGRVDEAVVDGDRAGEHLEQRHLPDELVGHRLEHVAQRLAGGIGGDVDLHAVGAGAGQDRRRALRRRGAELADEVGQPVDADPGGRRADEHGELDPVEHLVGQRSFQFGRRRHVACEVALELLVVTGDDLLDELLVTAVLLVGDVVRERLGVVPTVRLVLEALVGEHVSDAVEALLLAERELEGDEAGAEPLRQVGQHSAEVGPWLVLLVDEHHPRDAPRRALGPAQLRADLHPVDRVDDDHREVGDRQRGVDVAGEVGVPGCVDEVDLVGLAVAALPLERRHGERQRHRALDLLRLGVADGGAVLDPSGPGQDPRPHQQRFDQCRLAAAAVSDDGDVADLVRRRAVQS